jgi:TolB-like protein/tetratricopeptide (TPR) repeat protein
LSLYAELKRRNVFRVAAAYIVLGWLFLQVSSVVLQFVGAPAWVGKAIIALLVIGFVPSLAVAWVFEVGPEGVKRDDGSAPASNGQHARRLDILTLVGMFALAIFALADNLRVPEKGAVPESLSGQATPAAAQAPAPESASDTAAPLSVAVLPFANLSGNPDEAYFSDGMTEEILNVLARISHLKVAARTSVFAFKDRGGDVREIGRKLGVSHIVEGSVRRDGGKVRVTAQLIRVADGFHDWSQSYDRELTSVFAIQDDIAGRIAAALQASLGTATANRAEIDPVAYDHYLRGLNLRLQRRDIGQAIVHLDAAVSRAPGFAAGWAALSLAHELSYWYMPPERSAALGDMLTNMRSAAQRAAELDPDAAITLHAQGNVARAETRYADALGLYERAIAVDATYPDVREDYVELLSELARYADAERASRELLALEPVVWIYWFQLGSIGWSSRRDDLVAESSGRMRELEPTARYPVLMQFWHELRMERIERARAALAEAGRFAPAIAAREVPLFRWALHEPVEDEPAVRRLILSSVDLTNYPALRGDPDVFFGIFENPAAQAVRYKANRALSAPVARRMLESERGKQLLIDAGIAAYWREHGWPPLCRPVGSDDFTCAQADPVQ